MSVRILIVEEDGPAREALIRVGTALGHECRAAENVEQAMAALAAESFGLCTVSLGLAADAFQAVHTAAQERGVPVYDLPSSARGNGHSSLTDLPPHGVDLRGLLSQLEDRLIGQALERTGGNRNRAAGLLGMNRTTLVEKLRRRPVD
jgi:DNA-binding NtrC family response regulator